MSILIINIKELLQVRKESVSKISGLDMKQLPTIKNAFLHLENDLIAAYGSMDQMPEIKADEIIDATGRIVMPTWIDSHTHIVYEGNREDEFVDRINGLSYEEIAMKGGGILNSAKKLKHSSIDSLVEQASKRLDEMISLGTGAVEIKSGYGLSTESEIKMLEVIKILKSKYNLPIKATFLGAHAFPSKYQKNKSEYVDLICNEMIPMVAEKQLADYIDVFCEKGYFDLDQTKRILDAGLPYGLIPKIHVNQFYSFGGVALGVDKKALSVDHLEELSLEDINVLKESDTMPVALPLCSYFLSIPYTPARAIIDSGLPLALATDFNPGSAPSGNMNLVVATACIKMKMTPEEAINAATINAAYAINLSDDYGSITVGKKANVMITKEIPSYNYLPYAFGSQHIEQVFIHGEKMK